MVKNLESASRTLFPRPLLSVSVRVSLSLALCLFLCLCFFFLWHCRSKGSFRCYHAGAPNAYAKVTPNVASKAPKELLGHTTLLRQAPPRTLKTSNPRTNTLKPRETVFEASAIIELIRLAGVERWFGIPSFSLVPF